MQTVERIRSDDGLMVVREKGRGRRMPRAEQARIAERILAERAARGELPTYDESAPF